MSWLPVLQFTTRSGTLSMMSEQLGTNWAEMATVSAITGNDPVGSL